MKALDFAPHIVPSWPDKPLPWRRAGAGKNRHWLDNVVLASSLRAFLQTLPHGKLPYRKDFTHYGLNHDAHVRAWKLAISAGQRLRDALAAFADRPDLSWVHAIR